MWFDEESPTDCGRITGDSSLILVKEELPTNRSQDYLGCIG